MAYCFKDDPPCPQVTIPLPPAKPPCPDDPTNDRKCGAGTFTDLVALRGGQNKEPSLLFKQSKSQYSPGYEANSIEEDPRFRQIGTDGVFRVTDDLRLDNASPANPAIGAGVPLLGDLLGDLGKMDPFAPTSGNPDIGCYPSGSGPLRVGVDGRRSYPIE